MGLVTPTPSAALDIGSNSVHLLVAHRGSDDGSLPRVVPLVDVSLHVGIGPVVDATGELGAEVRESLRATVEGYLGQARDLGVTVVLVLGTEALRRAADTAALVAAIGGPVGRTVVVLDRAAEALLMLLGVTGGRVDGSLAAVDIGGGSTQVAMARPGERPRVASLDVGSASLAAAHVTTDPVTEAQVDAMRRAARQHVSALDMDSPDRVVIAGGSGTNVSRLLGRDRTTPVGRADIASALTLLQSHPARELAARTGLTPRRVAQLAAGLAIGEALLDDLGLDAAEVSDASLREGSLIAWWLAGDQWLEALPSLVMGEGDVGLRSPAPEGVDRAS